MSTLKKRQNSRVLAAIYILCFALAILIDSGYGYSSAKVITVVTVAIAIGVLFITGDFTNLDTIASFFVLYGIWFLVVLVYSALLWILSFETVSYIARGCAKILYQFIMIFNLCAAAYLFGEKGIHYMFWGLALGNLAIAVILIPQYPVSEILSSITLFLTDGGTAEGYMKGLEIHDVTFTYGFFLIYFIFFDDISSKRMKIVKIIVAVFLFGIGYKRIAVASLILILVIGFVFKFMTPHVREKFMRFILIAGLVGAFLYLLTIKSDLFLKVIEELNIDVKGRNVLYDAIDKYWNLTPAFVGYGFEYVHVMMQELAASGNTAFNNMVDIHNDFIRVYMEMGFFGFWVWGLYTLIFQFNRIKHRCGHKTVCLFFLCEMYIFLTYLTDNTLFYFYTGTVLRMMPLCYALRIARVNSENNKLVVKKDNKKRLFEIFSKRGETSVTLYKKNLK